jgi:hypothetical protein
MLRDRPVEKIEALEEFVRLVQNDLAIDRFDRTGLLCRVSNDVYSQDRRLRKVLRQASAGRNWLYFAKALLFDDACQSLKLTGWTTTRACEMSTRGIVAHR